MQSLEQRHFPRSHSSPARAASIVITVELLDCMQAMLCGLCRDVSQIPLTGAFYPAILLRYQPLVPQKIYLYLRETKGYTPMTVTASGARPVSIHLGISCKQQLYPTRQLLNVSAIFDKMYHMRLRNFMFLDFDEGKILEKGTKRDARRCVSAQRKSANGQPIRPSLKTSYLPFRRSLVLVHHLIGHLRTR